VATGMDALTWACRGEELGIPFGPVVQVPADAPPYAQLVAWVGRDPEWGAA